MNKQIGVFKMFVSLLTDNYLFAKQ